MVLPTVPKQCRAVEFGLKLRIVGILGDDPGGDGFRSFCLCGLLVDIGKAHRHTQFKRIGVFDPLFKVAVVNLVVFAEGFRTQIPVALQRFQRGVQFFEHLRICFLLRVIGDGQAFFFVLYDLGVGYRAVSVGQAVHNRHAQDVGQGYRHFVVGFVDDAAVSGVSFGDDIHKRRFEPVGGGIER